MAAAVHGSDRDDVVEVVGRRRVGEAVSADTGITLGADDQHAGVVGILDGVI